jgi:hypothetical protein
MATWRSGPLNETPAEIRNVLNKFLTMKADESASKAPDCAIGAFAGLHGNTSILSKAPDCAIGAFIGLLGQNAS